MAWEDFCGAWQPLRTVYVWKYYSKRSTFVKKQSRKNFEHRERENKYIFWRWTILLRASDPELDRMLYVVI